MHGEAIGRRGGRATDKSGLRDMAMDMGGKLDTEPDMAFGSKKPVEEDAWSPEARKAAAEARGGKQAKDVSAHTQAVLNRIAYLKKKGKPADLEAAKKLEAMLEQAKGQGQDSLAGQKKELENKLKAGLLTKAQHDELLAKLEDPDSVIEYSKTPAEFETGGNVSTRGREAPLRGDNLPHKGRHGGRASDESIGGGLTDTYNPSPDLKTWQGQGGTAGQWQNKGRFGGRATDKAGARDCEMSADGLTPTEQTKFNALKERQSQGQLSYAEKEEFEHLRDKIGRIGFKSAGAKRADDEMATDPPVSEAQRRAMFAAKSGKSNLGIPQNVGKEFAEADPGGHLPEHKK